MKNTLVFIHIPRAGGGTFQNLLTSWYLPENCQKEVRLPTERQLAGIQEGNPYNIVAQHKRVLHGHFTYHPSYKDRFLCTFIRNPVDWTISRWAYHKTHAPQYGSVIDFMDWGFVNMQSKFLKGSTLDDFDFIGITDRYPESMKIFKAKAPPSKVEKWLNITDWDEEMLWQKKVYGGNYKNASKGFPVTDEEKSEILKRNQEDSDLYRRAVERFELQ